MVRWAAANILSREEESSLNLVSIKIIETPDAALARLTESYSTAMEAISGIHKLNRLLSKSREVDNPHSSQQENILSIILRASRAARKIFEDGILSDQLVQPFVTTLSKALLKDNIIKNMKDNRRGFDTPSSLSSPSQKNTLKKIIYLTLVNYADILSSICTCGFHRCQSDQSVLMKDFTCSCPSFPQNSYTNQPCVWDEPEEVTRRLILVSFCQAADLDGSDPVIWLRVAASARSFSVFQSSYSSLSNSHLSLHKSLLRLERYALERGLASLPPQVPANRCLAQAYTEHFQYLHKVSFESGQLDTDKLENITLDLNLTSYSWSALGRLLMSVCKEGGTRGQQTHLSSGRPYPQCMHLIGTPTLNIHIATILTIPQNVFGRIFEYLAERDGYGSDVKSLECTCRALAAAVVSTRAYKQRKKEFQLQKMENELINFPTRDENADDTEDGISNIPASMTEDPQQSQRSSKRLRSQVAASAKPHESLKEFGLREAMAEVISTHCADHPDYPAIIAESKSIEWGSWCPFSADVERTFQASINNRSTSQPKDYDCQHPSDHFILEGSLDLLNFVNNLNSRNSGPFDALRRFLIHVSLHVCNVFQSTDEGGRIILAGCLLDCFDFLSNNLEYQSSKDENTFLLNLAWENEKWIESFSLKLLHTELRLRKYERSITVHGGDFALLKTMIHELQFIDQVGDVEYRSLSNVGQCLVLRTNWLLSCFYVWLSKGPLNHTDVHDVQESDSIVSLIVEKIISFLSYFPGYTILTPHLAGPGRIGAYWIKLSEITLRPLRDEIQLNAILSSCRQNFQRCIGDSSLTADHMDDDNLLKRYGLESNNFFGRHHRELVNDFLSIYCEYLNDYSCQHFPPADKCRWPLIWEIISAASFSEIMTAGAKGPALLTIIISYLASKEKPEERMLCLFVALAVECIQEIDELLLELSSTSTLRREGLTFDWGGCTDDDDSLDNDTSRKNHRYTLLLSCAKFFLAKALFIARCGKFCSESITYLAENGGLSWLVRRVFQNTPIELSELRVDGDVIELTLQLVSASLNIQLDSLRRKNIYCVFLWSCRFVVVEEEYLKRQGPTCSDPLLSERMNIASVVLRELAMLILQSELSGFNVLFYPFRDYLHTRSRATSLSPLIAILDSCTFIWTFVSLQSAEGSSCRSKIQLQAALSRVRAPIASLMTSVCTAISINHLHFYSNPTVDEYNKCQPSDDFEEVNTKKTDPMKTATVAFKEPPCIVSPVVQFIGLVLNNIEDKDAVETFDIILFPRNKHLLLPSLTVKVLVLLSDFVLHSLTLKGKWSTEYPIHFHLTGLQIDAFLCKMYRILYGVALLPQISQIQSYKNLQLPSFNSTNGSSTLKMPESVESAMEMYRCIARIYRSGSRRYPPMNALECILRSLPPDDSKKSKAIRSFLLTKSHCDEEILFRMETRENTFSFLEEKLFMELPSDFPTWTLSDDSDRAGAIDEIEFVRIGCLHFLSKGPTPGYFASNADMDCDREEAFNVENALSQKVNELIDLLCLKPGSCNNWFQAGLGLSMKADLVNDRLPPLQSHPLQGRDFDVSNRDINNLSLPLNDLLAAQVYEFITQDRLKIVGDDLSFFVNTSWADFDSLRSSTQSASIMGIQSHVIQEAWVIFQEEKYSDWQNFWGRIFVAELQRLSRRCLHIALALHSRVSVRDDEDDDLDEDIAEALGINYYNNLMGAVSHGYPVCELTLYEKRILAKRAIICFEQVIANRCSRGDVLSWDLHFMIGKCYEKIATTLLDEQYSTESDSVEKDRTEALPRAYELFMKKSIQKYSLSICEIKRDSSVFEKYDGGGSSHGLWEVIYRLHASRFKTLLRYIKAAPQRRSCAEVEALRIVEESWYEASNSDTTAQGENGRVRSAFRDIVMALAQCRKENPYFHRSVYRHAQALLWAQVFLGEDLCNSGVPTQGLGMDHTRSHAENAKRIFEVLFDKKRSQICAVWLTTPARPNAFEFLNNFIRKFDKLRWKYCLGYIDCLRLCKDINTLQTMITWIDSTPRDLPSFYDKSAGSRGSVCRMTHHKDNLLCHGIGIIFDLARYANRAIADVIRQLLHDLTMNTPESLCVDQAQELLFKAYTCFRRLNCPINDDTWKSLSVRKRLEESNILEVEVLCECFMFIKNTESSTYLKYTLSVEAKMQLLTRALAQCESAFSSRVDQLSTHKRKMLKRKTSDT